MHRQKTISEFHDNSVTLGDAHRNLEGKGGKSDQGSV